MITKRRRMHLVAGQPIRHVQSSANPLFESAADTFGENALAIVLSGYDSDGTDGVQAISESGGTVLVQEPKTAYAAGMPRNAIATGVVDRALTTDRLADEIVRFAAQQHA